MAGNYLSGTSRRQPRDKPPEPMDGTEASVPCLSFVPEGSECGLGAGRRVMRRDERGVAERVRERR